MSDGVTVKAVTDLLVTRTDESKAALLSALQRASAAAGPTTTAPRPPQASGPARSGPTVAQLYGNAVQPASAWLQKQTAEEAVICADALASDNAALIRAMTSNDVVRVSALCGGSCFFHAVVAATLREWAGITIDKTAVRERYAAAFQRRQYTANERDPLGTLWSAARCLDLDAALERTVDVVLNLQATLWRACSWSLRLAVVATWLQQVVPAARHELTWALWQTLTATAVCIRFIRSEASGEHTRDVLLATAAIAQQLLDQSRMRALRLRERLRQWNGSDGVDARLLALVRTSTADAPGRIVLLDSDENDARREAALAWTYDEMDNGHVLYDKRAHWIDSAAAVEALAQVLGTDVHLLDRQCIVTSARFAQGDGAREHALYLYFTGDHFESGLRVDTSDGRPVTDAILNDRWWPTSQQDLRAIVNGLFDDAVIFDQTTRRQLSATAFNNLGQAPQATYADRVRARARFFVNEWREDGASLDGLRCLLLPVYAALAISMSADDERMWLALRDRIGSALPSRAPASSFILHTLVPHALPSVLRCSAWLSGVTFDTAGPQDVQRQFALALRGQDTSLLRIGFANLHTTFSDARTLVDDFLSRLDTVDSVLAASEHAQTWLEQIRRDSTEAPTRTLLDVTLGTDAQTSLLHVVEDLIDMAHMHGAANHVQLVAQRRALVALVRQWNDHVLPALEALHFDVKHASERMTRYAVARLRSARFAPRACALQINTQRLVVVNSSGRPTAATRDLLRVARTRLPDGSESWPWPVQVHMAANGYATTLMEPPRRLDLQLRTLILQSIDVASDFGTGILYRATPVTYTAATAAASEKAARVRTRLPDHVVARYGTFTSDGAVAALPSVWMLDPEHYSARNGTAFDAVLRGNDSCNALCPAALYHIFTVDERNRLLPLAASDKVRIVDEMYLLSPARVEARPVDDGWTLPMLDRARDALQQAQWSACVYASRWPLTCWSRPAAPHVAGQYVLLRDAGTTSCNYEATRVVGNLMAGQATQADRDRQFAVLRVRRLGDQSDGMYDEVVKFAEPNEVALHVFLATHPSTAQYIVPVRAMEGWRHSVRGIAQSTRTDTEWHAVKVMPYIAPVQSRLRNRGSDGSSETSPRSGAASLDEWRRTVRPVVEAAMREFNATSRFQTVPNDDWLSQQNVLIGADGRMYVHDFDRSF